MNYVNALNQSGFSWRTALALASSSQLVYQQKNRVERITVEEWGFDTCEFYSIKETQFFIATTAESVVVCFRGTMGLADWLRNLKAIRTGQQAYGKVHGGFFDGYHDAKEKIDERLADLVGSKMVWIAGHSLGGALAAICAAELEPDFGSQVAGVYTYGQPRTGNREFRRFMKKKYGDKFFRFVNDDDVVPRVPPNFAHVNELVHYGPDAELLTSPFMAEEAEEDEFFDPTVEFDEEDGGEEESDPGGESGSTEPDAMTEAEFEQLQATLGTLIDTSGATESDDMIEGFIPSVSDHDIGKYVNHTRFHDRSSGEDDSYHQEAQIDLSVQSSADAIRGSRAGVLGGSTESDEPEEELPIVIRANSAWVPPENLTINSKIGSVYTALATIDQIDQLKADPSVLSIDGSPESFFPEAVNAISFIKANKVHRAGRGETGDSALVGIIDTGIDILHEAFRDRKNKNKSRILYIWDQKSHTVKGKTPKDINPAFSAGYGQLYTRDEIDQMIGKGSIKPSHKNLRDKSAHGTHVASIAAGQAVGDIGQGAAPDAGIIFVIPRLDTEEGDPRSLGYSVTHLDGLVFMKEAAAAEGLPIAINMSLGMNAGSHDGTSPLEIAIDNISNKGRDPGLVIVKSAGNERSHNGHAHVFATKNLIETISWRSENKKRAKDSIQGWYNDFDDLEFRLISPTGDESESIYFDPIMDDPTRPKVVEGEFDDDEYKLRLTKNHPDNGNSLLEIQISNIMDEAIRSGFWKLEVIGRNIGSQDGRVDFWIERIRGRPIEFKAGASDSMTLSVPGTADSVICVAACEADGPPIRLTSTSSYGPTRLNKKKPEITAPGKSIFAAKSNTDDPTAGVAKTGTSMAAPHVTGAIALMLSKLHKKDPSRQLNAQQIRQLLVSNAMDFSPNHHPGRGFGILDVEKFLDSVP